jgi:hypothetical protein
LDKIGSRTFKSCEKELFYLTKLNATVLWSLLQRNIYVVGDEPNPPSGRGDLAEDKDSKRMRAGMRACWGGVEHETEALGRGLKQQEHELKLGMVLKLIWVRALNKNRWKKSGFIHQTMIRSRISGDKTCGRITRLRCV